jgi:nitrate reductase delta subunit
MNSVTRLYDALAALLAYPHAGFAARIDACREALGPHQPEAASHVERFAEATRGLTAEALEELYTQWFDLSPVCSLEVGWHLFGENYARGEFLVEMRQTLRQLGLAESGELPDHLTHVLAALGRMPAKQADRFASRRLLPVLDKMLAELRGKGCPYEAVLEAIQAVVLSPYGVALAEV